VRPKADSSPAYLANLNAVRGIAALLVVVFHVDQHTHLLSDRFSSAFVPRSYLMVDLFFALSGFVLCHVYGAWFARGVSREPLGRFALARFARIYPLHVFALTVLFGVVAVRYCADPTAWTAQHAARYGLATLPANVLLLQGMNVTPTVTWNEPSWSISTEWWMYALFPLLVGPVLRSRRVVAGAIGTLCLGGYLLIMLVLVQRVTVPDAVAGEKPDPASMTIDVSHQFGFLRCAAGFVLGMLTYRVYAAGRLRWLGGGIPLLGLAAGAAWCMHRGLPDPIAVAFFFPIVLSAAYGGRFVDVVLGARPLRRLGDWSYAIYMIHIPLLQAMFVLLLVGAIPEPRTTWHLWLLFGAYLAVTIAVSGLVYAWVEKPLRVRLRRLV
jgi:peptidoglycan/LPS O-acetylase OafA/YrhL